MRRIQPKIAAHVKQVSGHFPGVMPTIDFSKRWEYCPLILNGRLNAHGPAIAAYSLDPAPKMDAVT
jgi:hypothetical protein